MASILDVLPYVIGQDISPMVDTIREIDPVMGAMIDHLQESNRSDKILTFDDCRRIEEEINEKLKGVYLG